MKKTTHNTGTPEESVKKILNRLARLEGQVKGIRRMIEDGQQCKATVIQVSAVKQAAAMLAAELLENEVLCSFERGEGINKKSLEALINFK